MLDVLIIGAGVSGVSCAMVLGSAQNKPFANDKKIAIVAITAPKKGDSSKATTPIYEAMVNIGPGTA